MISEFPPSSRIRRIVLVVGVVCLLVTFAGLILVGAHKNDNNLPQPAPIEPAAKSRVADSFGRLPLSFEVNKGQVDQSVKFLSRGAGYDLFLTATETVLRLEKPRAAKSDVHEGSVLRLTMLGANTTPQAEGQDELPGKVNYFIGNDPAKWRRNVPTYRRVHFKDIYPGIDVVYYGKQRELEYDLVVAAGANPKVIRFSVEGADRIRVDKSGNLLLTVKQGELSLNKPVIYQLDENSNRREVKGAYVVSGNEVRFKLERFDSSKSLIIDPVLSYSTLLGSPSDDNGFGIAVDSQGSAYVTGSTSSTSFPTTPGAFKATSQRSGAFVTKLDPTGSTLVYSTYLSGEGITNGFGIAVDSSGNAYVTGTTSATDFPVVNGIKTNSNFFKTTDAAANWNNQNTGLAGSVNVLAVAPTLPNTIYAASSNGFYRSADGGSSWTRTTATGLTSFNFAMSMAVDPSNASVIYLGHSFGLFKSTNGGDNWTQVNPAPLNTPTVFSIVFDPSTASTMYVGTSTGVFKSTNSGSTWVVQNNFGIAGTPNVHALAIDPTAPLTIYAGTFGNGLFKSTNGGGVWTAMNNGMGGGAPTQVSAIVIDPANPSTIYTGHGSSPAGGGINKSVDGAASWNPLTNGVPNAGITAMTATSSAVYAAVNSGGIIKTTNGGGNWTNTNAGLWSPGVLSLIKHPTDASTLFTGSIGNTFSDAYVTKLNSTGSGLLFSTLLGGSREEIGNGIAVDGSGNISVGGQTSSANFPVANAVRSSVTFNGNCGTGFVTKLNPAVPSYVFSTYLGSGQCDVVNGVAADSTGNVYATGRTFSSDFPTANAIQPAFAGPQFSGDAFATKFTPTGSLVYSTYLGGTNFDVGFGIAADASGNAYITGTTASSDFPTRNPIQASGGNTAGDVFVTKLNSQGSDFVYSTYLGGTGFDAGRGIAVDSANNAYVAGLSDSPEFPLIAGALRTRSPMYKSVDGAANWGNDNYGFTATAITSLAIHPLQPSTIYAGTTTGIFKTTNGGRTWSPMNNGLDNRNVTAIVIDPSATSIVYAATSGLSNFGVYKSTDGGATWNRRSNGITSIQTIGLAIDPVTPNTLYAVFNNGSNGGIYKTTDGADNWVVVGNQPPFWPGTLVIDPLNHTTLYATDANNTGGVFKSTDAGLTWQGAGLNQTGPFGRSVAVSPLTPGLVYADTGQGLFKSVDGGSNWTLIPSRSGKIVFDPVSSSTVYLLSPQFSNTPGLFKSTDNGQTWKAVNKGLNTPQALVLVIDPLNPSNLYLASQPSGGSDAFVTKFNPAGSALIYSTFLGGPTAENLSGVTAQAFAIALDNGSNAYVTGITSAAAFPVTNNSYQPFIRGGNDAFISKLTMSYIIGGQVLNNGASPLNGVEVILNDGVSLSSVMTENDGTYQFSHLREGGSFTVSASKPHFTVTPASQTFNNLNSDQVLNFTAITSDSPFFTISGQVTENGVPLAGVTVTLSGSQSGIRTTDSNGNYSFEVIIAGNYTVTPSMLGFNFGPASQTFNALTTNQTANFPATRQSFVVTNANNHGTGSLREAIVNANATLGTDTITFNIPGPGVKTISLLTALPEITERVVIDGTTQPGYAGTPLIELDGFATNSSTGLVIKAGGSTVRGLSLGNFRGNGAIWLTGCDNNVIQANYVGIAADGTTARPNSSGIVLNNSSNNIIGGTTAASRNVISGNLFNGVELNGNTNVVQGNFIGTNAAGTAAIANTNGVGVISSQYTDNLIGGTAAGARNLISGNQTGVVANGTGTTIQGNLIGTDATGTNKVPNNNGVRAQGLNILVGGLTPGARNVISGNLGNGVDTRGAGNKVQGNFIGTDITGTLALGNDSHGVVAGDNALIGGTVPEARNIISGNGSMGSGANVALGDNNAGSAAMVQGNYIGTDVTGMSSLHNPLLGVIAGISISSSNNIIGGVTAGARNVISGNDIGIQVGSSFTGGAFGNVIQGNFIGLNAAGTGPLPNMQQGIAITDGVNNTIGSTQSQAGNKIAFNNGPGVTVTAGSGATGNAIRGNSIFSNNGLGIDLGTIGVTANDGNDTDTGANNLQNFPVITTVLSSANSTTIQGSLKSIPLTTFQLDFYSNAAVDPSGNGEGAQFFNTTPVTTDANGDATINVTFPAGLPSGRVITATATDPNGNTSEFSAADSTSAAGSVQFRTSSIAVIEDIGVLTVNVLRTGGAAGSISVDYATSDGTAIAGQDYTAASGTLNFNSGETLKTFQIPIADDGTTEPDETFTVTLRNASSLEALGAPSIMNVTIQDRTTTPLIFITDAAVVEGNTGSETDLVFTVALSAATGKTVSGNYSMLSFSAFGGNKCDNAVGIDYINTNGSFSFQPGTTEFSIPVKVCGDPFAEANETFRVLISNVSNATLLQNQAIGTIINDDVLGMLLEESGPSANQAVAIDAVLGIRDPFRWLMPDWYSSVPQNTRVMLFAQNLQLNPNEVSSAVIVRLTASNNQTFDIPAEDVRALRESEFTQVVFRLPTNLPAGNCTVVIRAHSRTSNSGTIRIVP